MFACAAAAAAQAPPAPAFDVASLKPSQPKPPYPVDLGNVSHGTVTLTNVTLTQCLQFAFNIRNERQIDGPVWIKDHTVLFSIVAKAPPETPPDDLRRMMATLLNQRFQMTLHHEQREISYFAVTADPKRLNLPDSKADAFAIREFHHGRLVLNKVPISVFLILLGQFTSEVLVDKTGLTGAYDVKLEWTPQNQSSTDAAGAPADLPVQPLFEALEAQLGLKLDRRKGPFDVVVVDHAEKAPTEN